MSGPKPHLEPYEAEIVAQQEEGRVIYGASQVSKGENSNTQMQGASNDARGNGYAPRKAHGGSFDPSRIPAQKSRQDVPLPPTQASHIPSPMQGGAISYGTSSTVSSENSSPSRTPVSPIGPKRHGGRFVPGQTRPAIASGSVHGAGSVQSNGQGSPASYPPGLAQTPVDNTGLPGGLNQHGANQSAQGGTYRPPANGGQYNPEPQIQQIYYPPPQQPVQVYSEGPQPSAAPPQQNRVRTAPLKFGERSGIADTAVTKNNNAGRTYQLGYANALNHDGRLRWKYPNIYQMPGRFFAELTRNRHRDIMQRVWNGPEEDRYLSPCDGHLAKLVVQVTQDVYSGEKNSTWRRTFIRNVSPSYIKVANFPFSTLPPDMNDWDEAHWATLAWKWIPACCALLCVLAYQPNAAEGEVRNQGFYDPFPYRYWGYPKVARNQLEGSNPPSGEQAGSSLLERSLGPKYLCFLNKPHEREMHGVSMREVDQAHAGTEYLFIGYTTEQFDNDSYEDMTELHAIAERAAREAKIPAFWVAGSCMGSDEEVEDAVYRISDVIRGAHSLVIAVGPSSKRPEMNTREEMLKMWGERMWTLPEALLSSADHPIKVYTRSHTGHSWNVSKKHFAAVVWHDPLISRQLVDHYNKTLDLSRLELVSIALNCLIKRQTTRYFDGDLSYALMGLLRQRPKVDRTDSTFQAFARLSMANDSDMLLERLVCMLPNDPNGHWLAMDDAWNSSLWDIYPTCQVAGMGPGDTVILDGAFGAAIRWKAFAPVAYLTRGSWKRFASRALVHGSPSYFLTGVVLASYAEFSPIYGVIGVALLVISLVVILASPYLIRLIYGGKLWATQAWFFGFEGYLDLATIESSIYGSYNGRLKWAASGSTLSRHEQNLDGECVGLDPTTDPTVRNMLEQAKTPGFGGRKVFTLVDTYTSTVTMFTAVRPPVAAILCGREGGMQRAVLCSYDWKTQTLYRETVLRIETPVLERMFRVHKLRFGFQRPVANVR